MSPTDSDHYYTYTTVGNTRYNSDSGTAIYANSSSGYGVWLTTTVAYHLDDTEAIVNQEPEWDPQGNEA